jgi:TP901 family phage tail tape measure protein
MAIRIEFDAITGDLVQGFRRAGREADVLERRLGKTAKEALSVRDAALRVERAQVAAARATRRYGADHRLAAEASMRLEKAQAKLNHELREATGANAALAASEARVAAAQARTDAARSKALATTRSMGSSLLTITRRATIAGAALAGIGAGFVVKNAVSFEQQMSRVQAKLLLTKSEMAGLNRLAVRLGADTEFSATEAAAAMEELAAAGFDAHRIFKVLPGTMALASASGADLAQSAAIQTSTLNGFGLAMRDAARVADVLAQTANASAADIDDMQESIKYVAPVARASGQELESMMAAIGLMANVGIKGSQSGTTLRTAMVRLQAPTMRVHNALADLGLRIEQLQGPRGLAPMPDIIGKVVKGSERLDKATRNGAIASIFGREALSGMVALIERGEPAYRRMQRALEHSTGAARRAQTIMRDNVAGAWEQFTGAVESSSIALLDRFMPSIKRTLRSGADDIDRFTVSAGEFIDGLLGRTARFDQVESDARNVGLALNDIARTAASVAEDAGKMAAGLGKFVGKHDELRKVAGILAGVAVSVKAIKVVGTLTGANGLVAAAAGGAGRAGAGAGSAAFGANAVGTAAGGAGAGMLARFGATRFAAGTIGLGALGMYGANKLSGKAEAFYGGLVARGGAGSGIGGGLGGLVGRAGQAGTWLARNAPTIGGQSLGRFFPKGDGDKVDRDTKTLERFTRQARRLLDLRDTDGMRRMARQIANVSMESKDGSAALRRLTRDLDAVAKSGDATKFSRFRTALAGVTRGARWQSVNSVLLAIDQQWRMLPDRLKGPAGRAIIEASRAMERNGRLPRGSTDRIIKGLKEKWDGLGPYLRAAGARSTRELDRTLADDKIARRVQRVIDQVGKNWGDAPKLARTTAANSRVAWEAQMDFLAKKMKTTTGDQKKEAERLYRVLARMGDDTAGAARRAFDRSKSWIERGLDSIINTIQTKLAGALATPRGQQDLVAGAGSVIGLLGSLTTRRAGGRVNRFNTGGLVPALVSSGEEIVEPGGRSWMVPGPRVAADNVFAMLPVGAQVFTEHGQALKSAGMSSAGALAAQMPHFASGGVVRGKVSVFGPPTEAAEKTANGMSSAAAGIALNVQPGTDSGWNNKTTDAWARARQQFLVTIGRFRSYLPVIDKGPAGKTGRAIDVTGAGARKMGIDPMNFPTDAIGTAQIVGGRGAIAMSFMRQPSLTRSRKVDLTQPYGALDAFQQGFDAGQSGSRRLFRTWRGLDTDLFASATSGVRANERDLPHRVNLTARSKASRKGAYNPTSITEPRVLRAVGAANAIDAKRYPYATPGDRTASLNGPMDCSGAVSKVLINAGLMSAPVRDSTYFKGAWGRGGGGRYVTTYSRGGTGASGHVFMKIGSRYFGTSPQNPGGGAGWLDSFPGGSGWTLSHPARLRSGGIVRRFGGGGTATGQVVGRTQVFGGQTGGKRASVGKFMPKLAGVTGLLGSIGETGAAAGDVIEQMRALATLVENAKKTTYRRLESLRTSVLGQIVELMRGGETGQERIQIRRLRGVLTLLEGEMGKRAGLVVKRAQDAVDRVEKRTTSLSQYAALTGRDESEPQLLKMSLKANRDSSRDVAKQLPALQQQLARARALRQTEAVRAIREQIATTRGALTDLAVGIATKTREIAAAKIGQAISSISSAFDDVTKIGDDISIGQRVRGVSADSLPGMRERLGGLATQKNLIATDLIPRATAQMFAGLKAGDLGSVTAAADLLKSLRAMLPGLDADIAELGRQMARAERYQPVDVEAALAQLTPDNADDLAAARRREALLVEDLARAQASGDNEAIIELAGELKSTRDSLDSLTQAIRDQQQETNDLLREANDLERRKLAVAEGESDRLLAYLTRALNGTIGGSVGLGFQTPFSAGAGPRY